MTTPNVQAAMSAPNRVSAPSQPWLPLPSEVLWLFLGVIGLYAMTVHGLLQNNSAGLWSTGEHSHGPIMLTLSIWLLVVRWREYQPATATVSGQQWAWPAFAIGFALFVCGRSLGIIYFEVGSFIPMLAGILLLVGGPALLNHLRFPVFFCVFMVPLPGFLIEPISHFVKLQVSVVVADLLWALDYPITRTGVVLNIGQYQLLVADACAGMRTLFMLEAMGIFYLNVIRHSSWLRNVGLACLVVPISFVANMLRVLILTLITYHFGDEAGQGFMHGFAGIVLFASAMLLMMGLDSLFRLAAKPADQTKLGQA